ncbi:MAG: DNA glycosylase [Angelakisella sp.]
MNSVIQVGSDLLLPGAAAFCDLEQTLDCGQAFRWTRKPDGSYLGVAHGAVLRLSSRDGDLRLYNTTVTQYHAIWANYFDLTRDYGALQAQLCRDPVLRQAVAFAPGIRVLRQQPWETLCTFILSANNNIPRIKSIVERLCGLLGDPLGDGLYSFPPPERLAVLCCQELEPLRCGYRARYLLDAAQRIADGRLSLEAVAALPTAQARQALLTVTGVGPKVADCTLLFGFGRNECVPMDTWMKKVMAALYPDGLPQELLPIAGIAQQYLFHYARQHKITGTKEVTLV